MPDWLEVTLRTLLAVGILVVATKLLGKRQLSQLSLFEYITGITIGSLAAYVSLELQSTWYLGVIAIIVWSGISMGVEYLQLKSKRLRSWIDGEATIFIKDGKILEDELKKERFTTEELLKQLRKKNVFHVADVEFAILEPSGELNVLLKQEHRPLTPKQLGLKLGSKPEPQTVILDGVIIDKSLSDAGRNRQWLQTELEKKGISLSNVFLAQVDADGQLYVDLYDDQLNLPEPNQKELLLATLKKCEADLELFALASRNQKAKTMYTTCSTKLKHVIEEVKPILLS